MFPPIFTVCAADPAVTAVLGANPVRLFPAGEAPEGVEYPYAVWQTIYGAPENLLGDAPGADGWGLQVDVYASTLSAARVVAEAIRDAVEEVAYIAAWRGESRDSETRNYRYSFDIDWLLLR